MRKALNGGFVVIEMEDGTSREDYDIVESEELLKYFSKNDLEAILRVVYETLYNLRRDSGEKWYCSMKQDGENIQVYFYLEPEVIASIPGIIKYDSESMSIEVHTKDINDVKAILLDMGYLMDDSYSVWRKVAYGHINPRWGLRAVERFIQTVDESLGMLVSEYPITIGSGGSEE